MGSQLNWVAIRRGEIYCAPACGGKCTWAAYKKAQREAKAVASDLGRGWVDSVFENLGWHWHVINEDLSIDVSRGAWGGFHALIARRWSGHGPTPKLAIRTAVLDAIPELEELRGLVSLLERNRDALSRRSAKRISEQRKRLSA